MTAIPEELLAEGTDEPDEPDTPDEPEPDEPEPDEPEAEASPPDRLPVAAPSPEVLDKRRSDGARDWQRTRKRLETIYGEEWTDFLECPLCDTNHKGMIYKGDIGNYPKEIVDVVNMIFGFAAEQDYKQASNIETCVQCDGLGKVRTGSHVAGNESVPCRNCGGFGYYPPPEVGSAPAPPVVSAPHAPAGQPIEPLSSGTDSWGEPVILPDGRPNPNHGKMPSHKVQVPPWGTTANLTAMSPVAQDNTLG